MTQSAFDADFAAACLPPLLEQFGSAVVRRPSHGDDVSLQAIVDPEVVEERDDAAGRRRRVARSITIALDPTADSGGVADPSETDTWIIDGAHYAVERMSRSGSDAKIELIRVASAETSRPGYRQR